MTLHRRTVLSFLPGDPCPTCGRPLERRPRQFYWRGDFSDGAVCAVCDGLWPITGEEMAPLRPHSTTGKVT